MRGCHASDEDRRSRFGVLETVCARYSGLGMVEAVWD